MARGRFADGGGLPGPGRFLNGGAPAHTSSFPAGNAAPAPRTYQAQRPTLPDVPPAVVTAPGPAWPLLAVPVGLLPILLAVLGLNRQMWSDEYVTYSMTRLTWPEFRHLIGEQDLVHGLYYTLMRLWTDIAGTSLLALRFPSILATGVAAGALTLLGRRLFSTRAGLLAGLVLAVLPTVSRYGQEVRSYAMVSALVVIATLVLTYAIERPDGRRWAIYTAVTVLAGYLHVVALLILLPHALLVLHGWRRERDRAMAWWIGCAAAVVVAAAPLLYFANGQSGPLGGITADPAAVRRYPAGLAGSDLVVLLLLGLALAGAINLARHRAANMTTVLVWAVFPPLFCFVTSDLVHLFRAEYALYALPAWALLAAGVTGVPVTAPAPVPDRKPDVPPWAVPSRKQWLGAAALTAIVLVPLAVAAAGFPAHRDLRRSPLAGEPDFRAAAAVVDRGFQPGDAVVYAGTTRSARLPFRYELRSSEPHDVFAAGNQQCTDPPACLGKTSRVWMVVSASADDWTGLTEAQKKALQRSFRPASKTQLDNVRVVLLQRK